MKLDRRKDPGRKAGRPAFPLGTISRKREQNVNVVGLYRPVFDRTRCLKYQGLEIGRPHTREIDAPKWSAPERSAPKWSDRRGGEPPPVAGQPAGGIRGLGRETQRLDLALAAPLEGLFQGLRCGRVLAADA